MILHAFCYCRVYTLSCMLSVIADSTCCLAFWHCRFCMLSCMHFGSADFVCCLACILVWQILHVVLHAFWYCRFSMFFEVRQISLFLYSISHELSPKCVCTTFTSTDSYMVLIPFWYGRCPWQCQKRTAA